MQYLGQSSNIYAVAAEAAFYKYSNNIFPSEKDFLRHLFTVLGNGYGWIDGALITDMFSTEEIKTKKRRKSTKTFENWYSYPSRTKAIYKLCEHSEICNIPEDIKPDWLNACKRAIKLFKEEYQMTDNDAKLLDIAQETIERIESERKII